MLIFTTNKQTEIIANKTKLVMILGDLNFHRNFVRPSGVIVTETASSALHFGFVC